MKIGWSSKKKDIFSMPWLSTAFAWMVCVPERTAGTIKETNGCWLSVAGAVWKDARLVVAVFSDGSVHFTWNWYAAAGSRPVSQAV